MCILLIRVPNEESKLLTMLIICAQNIFSFPNVCTDISYICRAKVLNPYFNSARGGGHELSPSSLLLANIHDQIINYGNQTGSFANGTEKKN